MTKQYLISWNAGYGNNYDVVEAESEKEAGIMAYDAWKDEADSQADYDVEEANYGNLEDFGFDPEDYGFTLEEEEG